ncbi:GGDEF domain-containing protein [Asanoa iriomotensis]|uniref:GGDEF domain-containing protein n=1 Tax=Asanoa iriomotensis TaxID=234613 RepID=UPI00194363A7|nr:GGDEF domain-containing protein [Asanoa iriomotensis]
MLLIGAGLAGAVLGTGSLLLSAITAIAATAVLVVVLLVKRPAVPAAWWLLAGCSGIISYARLSYATQRAGTTATHGVGSGDIRAWIVYAALGGALILFTGRAREFDLEDTLDALIVGLGAFVILWVFLFSDHSPTAGEAVSVTVIRPIAAAVLLGLLTRLLFQVSPRTPAMLMVSAATLAVIVGSVAYALPSRLSNTGILFPVFSVLVAAAALHPSSVLKPGRRIRDPSRLGVARMTLFAFLTLLGPLAWVLAIIPSAYNPVSISDLGLPIIAAALISLLLLWRLGLIASFARRRSRELEGLQVELAHQAAHDPLTGLANRTVLLDKLDALCGHDARRDGRGAALLLLDLDGFKAVNDSLGHPAGDAVLLEVGRRLGAVAPSASTVVRLGGDEFAVLLPDTGANGAAAVAEQARVRLSQPFPTAYGTVTIGTSIGIKADAQASHDTSEALRDADLALYAAKAAGRNRLMVFAPALRGGPADQRSTGQPVDQ